MNPDWKKLLEQLVEAVSEYDGNYHQTERQKELAWQCVMSCYYDAKKALDENIPT